jgi:hypothetical protein
MWESLREALEGLLLRFRKNVRDRRVTKDRERFWSEVREGEREAEAKSSP